MFSEDYTVRDAPRSTCFFRVSSLHEFASAWAGSMFTLPGDLDLFRNKKSDLDAFAEDGSGAESAANLAMASEADDSADEYEA